MSRQKKLTFIQTMQETSLRREKEIEVAFIEEVYTDFLNEMGRAAVKGQWECILRRGFPEPFDALPSPPSDRKRRLMEGRNRIQQDLRHRLLNQGLFNLSVSQHPGSIRIDANWEPDAS